MPEAPDPKSHPHPWSSRGGGVLPASRRAGPDDAPLHAATAEYVELAVTTNFTFLTGASHPEEFVEEAARLGHTAAAICDLHTLGGVVRAHVAAKEAGIPLVVGARVRVEVNGLGGDGAISLLVFPTSRTAYGSLCRLLTMGKRRAGKGECHLTLHDVLEHHAEQLCVIMPPQTEAGMGERFVEVVQGVARVFDGDRVSVGAVCVYGPDDAMRLGQIDAVCGMTGVPMVALNDAHAHVPARRELHDVLTCVRHGCTIQQAGRRLTANAERHLKCAAEMSRLFARYPGAVHRTVEIARRALPVDETAGQERAVSRCWGVEVSLEGRNGGGQGEKGAVRLSSGFTLDQLRYEYPDEVIPAGRTAIQWLTELTWRGAKERFGEGVLNGASKSPRRTDTTMPLTLTDRIEHELKLIDELNYAHYFLTVHDIVVFARSRGILCQGRGAAANSAVCYCLGVTAVDPQRIDLLFERFVSKERNEPPDIDIDFEHERREEVIQYIYGKYGRDRAALTAEVISYRGRSAIRDVGKAMGLSLDLVDRLAKNLEWWEKGTLPVERLREMGLNPDDATLSRVLRLADEVLGFPRHRSQHVGGFVITRGLLSECVPIENAAMPERTVIEWDKDDIDAMGMLKVDVLGLGMLTCVSKAMALVEGWGAENGASAARSDDLKVPRCRGVKVSRGGKDALKEKSREGERHSTEASNHEQDTVIPRSDRLAEEQAPLQTGVPCNGEDAQVRDVRIDIADATCGGIDPVQHCRGVQPQDQARVHPWTSHRERVAGRTLDTMGDRCGPRFDSSERGGRDNAGGDRSDALCVDRETRCRGLSERASGCPGTSAPRHLDTSTRRQPLQFHTVPPEDPAVYDMICRADTIGVFQIESRAQMSMLPRLRPRCFYDLVIEVAIVRPGPIVGQMVHPYLRRRNHEEEFEYPSDAVREVLGKTLGVPLFQEQAMRLAIVAAGFTAGEADQLRRAMAAWKRRGDRLLAFEHRFVGGMLGNGYSPAFAQRCFEQLKGFSEYGFPESHAASFALIVYASAWLKCHHPAAFAAALINSQPMGFYAPAQIIRDAQEHGVTVLPVDANHSGWNCTLEPAPGSIAQASPALRLGMRLVSGMKEEEARRIAAAVHAKGPFESIRALWGAASVMVSTLRRLAAADAFGSLGMDRQRALWEVRELRDDRLEMFDGDAVMTDGAERVKMNAASIETSAVNLPTVPASLQTSLDYQAMGLSLKAHPVSFVRGELARRGVVENRALREVDAHGADRFPHKSDAAVAGIVLVRQRPSTANGVVFMTIEDETGIANLILRPAVYKKYRRAARHSVIVLARGRIERQGEVIHINVAKIEDAGRELGGAQPLAAQSRDFH